MANTHPPVDLDLVLNIFRRPVRERFTLLLDALGAGLAARGEDLNQTIRRAAPGAAGDPPRAARSCGATGGRCGR